MGFPRIRGLIGSPYSKDYNILELFLETPITAALLSRMLLVAQDGLAKKLHMPMRFDLKA